MQQMEVVFRYVYIVIIHTIYKTILSVLTAPNAPSKKIRINRPTLSPHFQQMQVNDNFDGLMQARRNSIANTLELRLFALSHGVIRYCSQVKINIHKAIALKRDYSRVITNFTTDDIIWIAICKTIRYYHPRCTEVMCYFEIYNISQYPS